MTTLEGQTILVVGGSSGIGYGVAKLSLLSEAARVIIASSSKAKVDNAISRLIAEVSGTIPDAKGRLVAGVLDARTGAAVREFLEKVGEIDHLVWTSGDGLPLGFHQMDLDSMRSESSIPCSNKVVSLSLIDWLTYCRRF